LEKSAAEDDDGINEVERELCFINFIFCWVIGVLPDLVQFATV
jgi:hypothetical protein